MANETKQYAQWIDVPDGQGGLERKWLKDAEAQVAIQYLQTTVSSLQPRYQVTISGHTAVFGNNATLTGHKLILT